MFIYANSTLSYLICINLHKYPKVQMLKNYVYLIFYFSLKVKEVK